jgi:tetratricopeptide (TPR) repeat protein
MLLILAGLPAPVYAQAQAKPAAPVSPEVKKQAKAHFKQGKAYQDAGDYKAAVDEYMAAYKLLPIPELLFNLAQVYRLMGDKHKALDTYRKFVDAAPEAVGSDDARAHIARLKLEIEAEDANEAAKRAQSEAQAARRAQEESTRRAQSAEVDARRHDDISRRNADQAARDQRAAEERLHRAEADEEARRAAGNPGTPAAARPDDSAVPGGATTVATPAGQRDVGHIYRMAGAATMLGGLLAITGGAVYGGLALSESNKIKNLKPGDAWTPALAGDVKSGQSDQTSMYALYGVGGALVIGGAVLYYVGMHSDHGSASAEGSRVSLAPVVTGTSGGVLMQGSF